MIVSFWALLSLCLTVSSSFLGVLCLFVFRRGRGLTFTSPHVLVRAPIDGSGFPPTDGEDHTQREVRALVPSWAVIHCMCVVAKRVGCLHRLAHAAGHGHFSSASTTRRTVCSICSRTFTLRSSIHLLLDVAVLGSCCNACLKPRRAPFLAHNLNSKMCDRLPMHIAVLGSCCNAK